MWFGKLEENSDSFFIGSTDGFDESVLLVISSDMYAGVNSIHLGDTRNWLCHIGWQRNYFGPGVSSKPIAELCEYNELKANLRSKYEQRLGRHQWRTEH